MNRILTSLAYAALMLAVSSVPSRAQDLRDLILSAEVDRYQLSGGMLAFERDGTVLLPIAELGMVLGFFIESNTELGVIEGWALAPERYFVLRGPDRIIETSGGEIAIAPESYLGELELMGEAYLPSDQLEDIWPVRIEVDIQRLLVRVIPDEPLPLQTRLARQQQWDAVEAARATLTQPELPDATLSYRGFSLPIINAEADATLASDVSGGLSLSGRQDVAFGDFSWFYSQSTNELTPNMRFRYSRDARIGALPFRLSQLDIGDIKGESDGYIMGSVQGRGVALTTFDRNMGHFGDTTVEGDAAPGWDAELHLGGALIDFQTVSEEGRYEFIDVPLFAGQNDLKVVLYGPNGQVEYRRQTIVADHLAAPSGTFDWSLRGGTTATMIGENDDKPGQWVQGLFAYGLSDITTTYVRLDGIAGEGSAALTRAGLSTSLASLFLRPEILVDAKGEIGGAVTVSRRYGFGIITAEWAHVEDLHLPHISSAAQPLAQHFEVESNNAFRAPSIGLTFGFDAMFDRFVDGTSALTLDTRQSVAHRSYRLTNTLEFSQTNEAVSLASRTALAWNNASWNVRAGVGYDLMGPTSIQDVSLAAGWLSQDQTWSMTGNVGHNFPSDCFDFRFTAARQFRQANVGLELGGTQPGTFTVGLRLSSVINLAASEGDRVSYIGPTSGRVLARIFIDRNGNGTFDAETDEPIRGIGARVNRGVQSARSDDNGLLVLDALDGSRLSTITLALRTIEDPYLVPAVEGIQLIARAGTVVWIDLPLVPVGSIDGTLLDYPGGRHLRATDLAIIDEYGAEIAATRSSYDGYFAFEQVPLGAFTIILEQTGRAIAHVSITADEPFVYGLQVPTEEMGS